MHFKITLTALLTAFAIVSAQLIHNDKAAAVENFENFDLHGERLDAFKDVSKGSLAADPPSPEPEEGPVDLPAPASDDVWGKAVCRGTNLYRAMTATDKDAGRMYQPSRDSAASSMQNFPYLFSNWGYRFNPTNDEEELDFEGEWGIKHVLEALGYSGDSHGRGGRNQVRWVTHYDPSGTVMIADQRYKHKKGDGTEVELPGTGAYFLASANQQDGVLIVKSVKTPQGWRSAEIEEGPEYDPKIPDDKMPELSKASDILWGIWKGVAQETGGNIANIRTFIALTIHNEETLALVSKATNQAKLKVWPGVTFNAPSDMGKAIIGSPIGSMFGHFLTQHKAELGIKFITAVSVFYCQGYDLELCLAFHVY